MIYQATCDKPSHALYRPRSSRPQEISSSPDYSRTTGLDRWYVASSTLSQNDFVDVNPAQREQAGLARPGASNPNLRVPISPWHRTPSTPSLNTDLAFDNSSRKESLAELWSEFLEQEAAEGVKSPRSPESSAAASSSTGAKQPP